ncbi:unnamed protein product [Brachionus calyciflorus]|uniref:Nanos-type domain-containing protein n=1 Tax=Brachionus calyciflorus TaxID=104777 RepID=A0A813U046_9BILA|nr:unnamed protein product [Brachionus calyciflorus]
MISSSNTFLVAGLQHYVTLINIDSFLNNASNTNNKSVGNGLLSPTSSIESSNSGSAMSSYTNNSYSHRSFQSKLERPSDKIKIDVTKYQEQSARILEKNPNKIILCSFCKNNGEPEHIYRSHSIKNIHGRVTCPLLKEYKCPVCGESGENAHTITYCKKLKAQKRIQILSTF